MEIYILINVIIITCIFIIITMLVDYNSNYSIKKSNDSSDFVILNTYLKDAIYEIRYSTSNNFVGKPINGYEKPLALITKEAAKALKEVNDELLLKGLCLKIYDAYRPTTAVKHFIDWSKDKKDTLKKSEFYPETDKSVLIKKRYIAKISSHSRGSAVDLTLYDLNTKKEVDMGGTFDFFGKQSYSNYKYITKNQRNNRLILRNIMINHGFKPVKNEWWHFTLKKEPYPNTYFDFPINSKSIMKKNSDH